MSKLSYAQECWESPPDEPAWDELAEALHDAITELEMAQCLYARGERQKAEAAIKEAILMLGGQP